MALCQTKGISITLIMITIVLAIGERRKKFNRKRNGITHIRCAFFFIPIHQNLPFISLLARLLFFCFSSSLAIVLLSVIRIRIRITVDEISV